MKAEDLADEAYGSMGGEAESSNPFGSGDDELEAYMTRFLKAAANKDTAGMAKAFRGACEACS